MQTLRTPAAYLCVFLLLTAPAPRAALSSATRHNSLLHKPAPQFVRNDLDGHPVDLSSFRGRVVLLTFWATWCAPCQVEMPTFIRWQSELGPQRFQIVAISMDDNPAPVVALTRRRGVNYPVIMGDAELGRLYGGILGLPVTFLIDRQGNVAARYKGAPNMTAIKSQLLRLIAAK